MSSAAMIKALGERVAYEHLSEEELRALALGEGLAIELCHLGKTISGLASLVEQDGNEKTGAGNFQHASDVSELLYGLGADIEAKGELVAIANLAQWKLGQLKGAGGVG